jgi:hypothetical protein
VGGSKELSAVDLRSRYFCSRYSANFHRPKITAACNETFKTFLGREQNFRATVFEMCPNQDELGRQLSG